MSGRLIPKLDTLTVAELDAWRWSVEGKPEDVYLLKARLPGFEVSYRTVRDRRPTGKLGAACARAAALADAIERREESQC